MVLERRYDLLELVADVELRGVEEKEDEVAARGKPLGDLDEVVVALDPLLFSREDAGSVHDRHLLEQPGRALGAFEPACEVTARFVRTGSIKDEDDKQFKAAS